MKKLLITITVFLLNICSFAQSTTLTLPTTDATSSFNVTDNASSPKTLLNLNGDAGFYLGGTYGAGTIPVTGAGVRLMWYPSKGAFRVGGDKYNGWDADSIGEYSSGIGFRTKATAYSSVALGFASTARGQYSTAICYATTASGLYSLATGNSTTASGQSATAMGISTTASAEGSTALGSNTTASGRFSTAMGLYTTASGEVSTAIGNIAVASGSRSTAIGSLISTNGYTGAMILGDYVMLSAQATSSADNQMTMRFRGGYRLFSDGNCTIGMSLAAGGSSWESISDSTKKENIIKADGEYFLNSLSKLKLGSWNYKAQDKNIRHYGPMAQEIFYYYGKDEFGIIGNDTTLASADMDGIMMICLQALEKRTEELRKENDKWEMENEELRKENQDMKNKMTGMLNSLQEQNNKISNQQNMLQKLAIKLEFIETKLNAQENKSEILSCNNIITTKDGPKK